LQYAYSGYSEYYRGRLSLSDRGTTRIVEDISRRRNELKTLLDVGGTLVLFLPAPDSWYVDTGKREHSGTGRNRQTTRIVTEQQLLSILPFPISAEAAETRELELKIGEPFSSFWRTCGDRFETSAILRGPLGETALVVKGTASIAASIARIERGIVITLPEKLLYPADEDDEEDDDDIPPSPHEWDQELLPALFDLVKALRTESGDFEQPEWVRQYSLPGEDAAAEEVRNAGANLKKAQEKLDEVERSLALRQQRKTLFTGTGGALEALVEEALVGLGFEIEEGRPGRTDRVAYLKKRPAVLEVKGLSKSAGEKDAAQLEKWVNEYFLEHGEMAKGILVVNAWRDKPLAKRTEQVFPNQMLKYAEARGHCLISATQLLGAWLEAESNRKRAPAIAKSILDCVGRYSAYSDWSKFVTHEESRVTEVGEPGENPD
jgi:hypothetical protein